MTINTSPTSQALTVRTVVIVTPVGMMTVKIVSVQTGVRIHWEIQGSKLRWRWFVDVDYFIAINVHTQPLDLRCRWRLVQKHVSQSLMDKRGKAMLPA